MPPVLTSTVTEQPRSALCFQRHNTISHFYSGIHQLFDIYLLRGKHGALTSDKYVHTVSISTSMYYAQAIRPLEIIWLRWTGKC